MPKSTEPVGEEFIAAVHTMARAAAWLEAAQHGFQHRYALELPDAIRRAIRDHEELSLAALQLLEAVEVVTNNTPVAPLSPRGFRWRRRLNPSQLIMQARVARHGDRDYFSTLEQNAATPPPGRRGPITSAEQCGRANSARAGDGVRSNCAARRAYLPGDQLAPACHTHLEPHEARLLLRLYTESVRTLVCPGCEAPATEDCVTDDRRRLRPVDGEWPSTRQFRGHVVHKVRLDAAESLDETSGLPPQV